MNVLLKVISKEAFDKLTSPILFQDHVSNRRFGIVTNGDYNFRIAWHSDTIEPEITSINSNVFSIGVDQNFAVFDFNDYSVRLRLQLTYNFFAFKLFKEKALIITELEILELNRVTFTIEKEYELPDLFEEIIVSEKFTEIKCAGDQRVLLS